ncbi:longevity assurance proteins LAG1/LAC1 [Dentipellis sp. KUC8613]|nr:longevity assurance proteins LAG1/LAC1 [Dentipellis sp. KUC8613]
MAAGKKSRARSGTLSRIETDASHHLTGPFMPQTPLEASPIDKPKRSNGVVDAVPQSGGLWHDIKTARWVVVPASSLRLLLIPIILHINWILFTPLIMSHPPSSPFAPLLFISHPTPSPTDDKTDPRYRKGPLDLVFIAYYIIFWSFVRQVIMLRVFPPVARYFGIHKHAKIERFGEQGYAMVYFAFLGFWGYRIMGQLPTWWYNTSQFWIDYPHWQMKPELKRYYLMQAAYWCQQLIVLILKLEKPRKDYNELVAHHFVTLWLVGWSYGINLTYIGNAVYMSMDIPDTFLALSKLINYIQWNRLKIVTFVFFLGIWTYFRHYLNLVMLWSVYKEFDLIPDSARHFWPLEGVWMVWWMKWQIFFPIFLLQLLNLFWYFFILRIGYRALQDTATVTDDRSDDEDDDDDGPEDKND